MGSAGLLMAKGIGARVIATAGSDWKLEKAKELGVDAEAAKAHEVIAGRDFFGELVLRVP